jgi:hypothetical protein
MLVHKAQRWLNHVGVQPVRGRDWLAVASQVLHEANA